MLKSIKIVEGQDSESEEITIMVNPDKIVQVRPSGDQETEIILDGNTILRAPLSWKQTLKSLS